MPFRRQAMRIRHQDLLRKAPILRSTTDTVLVTFGSVGNRMIIDEALVSNGLTMYNDNNGWHVRDGRGGPNVFWLFLHSNWATDVTACLACEKSLFSLLNRKNALFHSNSILLPFSMKALWSIFLQRDAKIIFISNCSDRNVHRTYQVDKKGATGSTMENQN